MTAAAVTRELGLAPGDTLTTPIRPETKQHTLRIMETNTSKPWATS